MSKNIKTILFSILGVLLIEIIAVIVGAYSGIPDVAATKPEGKIMGWFMNTTKDHSIGARAQHISVPPLDSSALVAKGFEHYNEMCVTCHGAPGIRSDELAKGLNPPPPNLAFSTRDMEPSEMFLVVKDGITMTGMPGFGSTHSDSEVWAIVAFLKRLQTMQPEEYTAFQKSQHHGTMEETKEHNHPKEH
ncbi:MAG: cytochrome c [Ignavibacteriales bacterium]|nr:cytochrome c [Ignavibacteriales bacterium]